MMSELLEVGSENKMFPGISISLYFDDSTYYFNKGNASLSPEESVSSMTRFQLGSIGKLVTAIAVLQQVDRGKLNLHSNIQEYVSINNLNSSTKAKPITLQSLLSHSAGFNDVNIGYMAKDKKSIIPEKACTQTQMNITMEVLPSTRDYLKKQTIIKR